MDETQENNRIIMKHNTCYKVIEQYTLKENNGGDM